MNADMHIMNLFHAEKRVPDRKESDNSVIKRGINTIKNDSSISGHECTEKAEDTSFQETFDTVSKSEKQKSTVKTQNASQKGDAGKTCDKKQQADESIKCENLIASEAADKKVTDNYAISPKQAIKIIQKALAKISEKLHLNIDFTNVLCDLDLAVHSEAVLEQFSEILYALKGISQLLGKAAEENIALDIKGVVVEPHEAAALEQILRVEVFRLQVALEALGVAGDVSRTVAERMHKPFMDGGVPKATDPTSLVMTENQLKQMLGDLMKTSEGHIESVVARIAAIAKERNPETHHQVTLVNEQHKDQNVEARLSALIKEQNSKDGKNVSLNVEKVTIGKHGDTIKPADLCAIDSQVMRRLLKIDVSGQNVAGQEKSDENEGKPAVFTLTSGSKMSSFNKNFQLLNTMQIPAEETVGTEASVKADGQLANMTVKLPTMPFKSIEESIILQVTQRLTTAVRSGVHQIRLVLRPESLGDMRMTIQMDGDVVMARINVENQVVKQIIESNLQSLKDSLEEHNLHAGSFDVNVNQNSEKDEQDSIGTETNDAHIAGNAEDVENDSMLWNNISVGTETGRRFGSNTIEYFA